MFSATLPHDVLHEIIDLHRHHRPTLHNWALTCRELSGYARALIFRAVSVNCTRLSRVPVFSKLVDSNPDIGALVKTLTVSQPTRIGSPDPQYPPLIVPWRHFPNVTIIRATFLEFSSMAEFFDIMESFPALEELHCDRVRWKAREDLPVGPDTATFPSTESTVFSSLKTMVFEGGNINPRSFMYCLRQRRTTIPLESVTLHHCPAVDGDYLAWTELFSMAKSTLRQVALYTRDGGVPDDAQFHRSLLDGLQSCSAIRHMSIGYRFANERSMPIEEGHFFQAVCTHLESVPTPHPDLEELTLCMVDRDGAMISVTPQLCHRLVRVLLDGSRYPRFRTLRISLWVETWHPAIRMALSTLSQGVQDSAKDRWRRAFAAFDDALDVTLEIETGGWARH